MCQHDPVFDFVQEALGEGVPHSVFTSVLVGQSGEHAARQICHPNTVLQYFHVHSIIKVGVVVHGLFRLFRVQVPQLVPDIQAILQARLCR